MARLTWDNPGSRFYETGLDRGVLYLSNGSGVAWNGLKSVVEKIPSTSTTPMYFDGKKYFDMPTSSDFSGTISAITYPKEFMQFDGYSLIANGMYFNNQNRNTFSLSFRTYFGNDFTGENYGYKLHIIYNLTADPSTSSYETITETANAAQFSWTVYSRPYAYSGYFPVSHIIIDSTIMTSSALTAIENKLYGTAVTSPTLATPQELFTLATT